MNTTDLETKDTTTPEKEDPDECSHKAQTGNALSNGGDVLSAFWLRRGIQDDLRLHRFLLDYHFYFLPYIGVVLWFTYLALQIH